MAIGASSQDDVNVTVESYSNVQIDVQVNGTELDCGSGSINVQNVTYEYTAGVAYSSMIKLLTTKATVDLNISKTWNTTATTELTHWKIGVPLGVQGVCSGAIQFTAVAG